MIIGACGYGGTGSSAIKDFLKEFENVDVLDRAESMFAFKVDGLQDLEYHLVTRYSREISGDVAIKRFRESAKFAYVPFVKKLYLDPRKYIKDTEEFIDAITQTTYRGMENFDYENCNWIKSVCYLAFKKIVVKWYEKIFKRPYTIWPMRNVSVSIRPENFYEEAKKYMKKIIVNGGGDLSKIIVLDQPFEGNNPSQSFPFFEDPYAIVIDRDPRDLYMIASYLWCGEPFMPRRDPEQFVEYYKRQRDNIDYSLDNDRVLRLNLEEMIFDYENVCERVYAFLGFNKSRHINKGEFFKPMVSMRGTQLYKKIQGHDNEIRYIEKNLTKYLFDYERFELSKTNTELTKSFDWQDETDKR